MVAYSDDVGMRPDIEPSKKTKNQGDKSIDTQLSICEFKSSIKAKKSYKNV